MPEFLARFDLPTLAAAKLLIYRLEIIQVEKINRKNLDFYQNLS